MSVWFAALLALATAPSAPPPHPAQAIQASGQEPDAEALRLLPSDAVLLVRLESIDKLLAFINRFGAAGGAPAFDADALVEDLGLPVYFKQIQTDRPVWFALT